MITLEILNHLATWVLNTDERFIPIKGQLPVQLTEAGLMQLDKEWFQLNDSTYYLTIQTFKDVLKKNVVSI